MAVNRMEQNQPLVDAMKKADLVTTEGNKELASEDKPKRTAGVAVTAILMWITWMFVMPMVYFTTVFAAGGFSVPIGIYIALAATAGTIAAFAAWYLRKWALWLFIGISLVHNVVLVLIGTWNPIALIVPALVAVFGAFQLRRR